MANVPPSKLIFLLLQVFFSSSNKIPEELPSTTDYKSTVEPCYNEDLGNYLVRYIRVKKTNTVEPGLVIKRSDIRKPSYNKVILLVPPLYISLGFLPRYEKPDITR